MNPFIQTKKQVSIFITAGYPELNSLASEIRLMERSGVDFIEIGIPFSDPMADGPVIQHTSDLALKNGMTTALIFEQLRTIQSKVPLVMMTYFNPILRYGLEKFMADCRELDIGHLIVPDISLEVYELDYQRIFETNGMTLCFLVTPTTSIERIVRMAEHSREGFIYLVSSNMTTGNATANLPLETYAQVKKACGRTPMMLGFGIRSGTDVVRAHEIADGAIIGSAYLRALSGGNQHYFLRDLFDEISFSYQLKNP